MPLESFHIGDDLLSQVAKGDENAFGQLFYAYHQTLADYVFHLTRSMPLTEEIVQDVFTRVWEHRQRLASVTNFRAYLFIISRNYTFNCMRDLAREASRKRQWAVHQVEPDKHCLDVEDEEPLYRLIEEAVRQLPPQQQKAYLLSRQKGLRHEDIALQLQLSKETVKRHISLALRAITAYVRANAGRIMLGIAAFFSCF